MKKITLAILCLLIISCTPDRKRGAQNDMPNEDATQENAISVETKEEQKEEVIEPSDNESESPEEKPLVTAEQMPSFKGGEATMRKFIADNLKYPDTAKENGIQGRVTVRFVVTQSGSIKDVNIIRGIDPLCDKEAVRVIKAMPNWEPGKQKGKAVSVYFTLPIVFKLQ